MDKTETSKTAVLVFVGMAGVAWMALSLTTALIGPAWAEPVTAASALAYVFFALGLRDHWWQATRVSLTLLVALLAFNYLRLHEGPTRYHEVVAFIMGAAALVLWRKNLTA
jgi:apolipoprotein N-acyltransferase